MSASLQKTWGKRERKMGGKDKKDVTKKGKKSDREKNWKGTYARGKGSRGGHRLIKGTRRGTIKGSGNAAAEGERGAGKALLPGGAILQ